MSQIVLEIPDDKDEVYSVTRFDTLAVDLDAVTLDGGHLIVLAPDRSVAVDTPLEYGKSNTDQEGQKPKKSSKKEGSKK